MQKVKSIKAKGFNKRTQNKMQGLLKYAEASRIIIAIKTTRDCYNKYKCSKDKQKQLL